MPLLSCDLAPCKNLSNLVQLMTWACFQGQLTGETLCSAFMQQVCQVVFFYYDTRVQIYPTLSYIILHFHLKTTHFVKMTLLYPLFLGF